MGKTAHLNARIDPELKEKAEGIFAAVGLSMTQAVTIFLKQAVYRRGIPFDVCVPNDVTIAALEEAKAGGGEKIAGDTAAAFDEIVAEGDTQRR
ncbi:MAG: type II toxin-antitoxin system RelB/DinJ family antitoxin [Bradyrhizobiaceae bacterium]|nr:type II toxin-antitoxin system RelB/DinJ family antitoxin [Bradyrhizobiaceae bacterium]